MKQPNNDSTPNNKFHELQSPL